MPIIGGPSDEVSLVLDNERDLATELRSGGRLTLDMRNPGSGGYQVSGASFDPAVLRLDHYLQVPPSSGLMGDFGRIIYSFTAVGAGETHVVVKIKRPWEGAEEVYKDVRVTVRD